MELILKRIAAHSSNNIFLKKLQEIIRKNQGLNKDKIEISNKLNKNNQKIFNLIHDIA